MSILSKILVTGWLALGSLFGYHATPQVIQYGDFNPTGGQTYRLQSSISTTQSTITLSSFKEPVSGIKYTMSYLNSTIEYGTIDPQNNNIKEFISFTGITQNTDGTALLTGVSRGLSFSYPYTASTTLAQPHSGQAIFILSNPPQLYNKYYNLSNVSTSTNTLIFSSTTPPRYDFNPSFPSISTTSLASVGYVNDVASFGAPLATFSVEGLSILASQAMMSSSQTSLDSPGVLYAFYSTSSPAFATGNYIPITRSSDNKLSPLFIATSSTDTYNFGGKMAFASSTFSATTTIAASSLINGAFRLNGVPYVFPSTQGATSTVFQNDGNGNLVSLPISRLMATASPLTYASSNASTTRLLFTVPANTLSKDNEIVITDYLADITQSSTNAIIFELGYGTASSTFTMVNAGADATACISPGSTTARLEVILSGNGNTSSQLITARMICDSTYSSTFTPTLSWSTTMAQDSTVAKQLMFVVRTRGSGANDRYNSSRLNVRLWAR